MTLREYTKKYLEGKGMFSKQADEVIAMAESDKEMEMVKERWDDDLEGYPPGFKALLENSINFYALKYIDEKIPKAWYRNLFV